MLYTAKVLDRWEQRVNGSAFMQGLRAGTLPLEAIRLFWKNWAFFVFEINNLVASTYQRHIGIFQASHRPDGQLQRKSRRRVHPP